MNNVIKRMANAIKTGRQMNFPDEHTATVVAHLLLDYLQGFHGIPMSEILQARRELGLIDVPAPDQEAAQAGETGQADHEGA